MELDVIELSRLQFAVVTIYHYFFVPLSMSLSVIVASLHTAWLRTGKESYRGLTMQIGKVLMVTFAVGVVTGLVQEFQFGLAWSDFARFYGDVFGPTLAMEGMLAFFLEATFLGLWYFGWNRMPAALHAATIWIVAIGTLLSAFIILAANSFMQSPVGYEVDAETGRARLGNFGELLLNELNLAAFPHTLAGAAMAGGGLVLAIGAYRAWGARRTAVAAEDHGTWRTLARVGAWVTLVGAVATLVTGDILGKVITHVQPMKMAAAEGLYETTAGAPFSLFALSWSPNERPFFSLDVPYMLSILATGDPNGTVQGLDNLQAEYTRLFGAADYTPVIPVAYWTFRLMIGVGMAAAAVALLVLWSSRRGRALDRSIWWVRLLLALLPLLPTLPLAANTFGWLFTETARQPWLVFGMFQTEQGVSPGLSAEEVVLSLAGFAVVYGVLAVVWTRLVVHIARQPLTAVERPSEDAVVAAPSY